LYEPTSQYPPAGQVDPPVVVGVGVVEPPVQIKPAEHIPVGDGAPGSLQYIPLGQAAQPDKAVTIVFAPYFPAGHGEGVVVLATQK